MAETVLRIRLTSGDHLDVVYEDPAVADESQVTEHVLATLAEASGTVRCRHGDRLIALYSRGVAAVEVAPRGAVL